MLTPLLTKKSTRDSENFKYTDSFCIFGLKVTTMLGATRVLGSSPVGESIFQTENFFLEQKTFGLSFAVYFYSLAFHFFGLFL